LGGSDGPLALELRLLFLLVLLLLSLLLGRLTLLVKLDDPNETDESDDANDSRDFTRTSVLRNGSCILSVIGTVTATENNKDRVPDPAAVGNHGEC